MKRAKGRFVLLLWLLLPLVATAESSVWRVRGPAGELFLAG